MTDILAYYYIDGACGTGKTHHALTTIAKTGGKHLFVVDRRETISERMKMATEIFTKLNSRVETAFIMSGADRNSTAISVRRRVHDLPKKNEGSDICAFITHEAMRMCEFSDFTGWSIWIDEVPSVIDNQSLSVAVSHRLLDQLYTLEPIISDDGEFSGWSTVKLRDTAVDLATIASDDLAHGLRSLHRRVVDHHRTGNRAVIVNGQSWTEFDRTKKSNWFSVWSPEHLDAFDRVTFLANAFTDSLSFQIMKAVCPNITWREISTDGGRDFAHRTVAIHYYAKSHTASRKLFGSTAGISNLEAIVADINSRVAGSHIWMCNRAEDQIVQLSGTKLSPRQAGSNEYRHVTAATCLYSVKPDVEQRRVYDLLGVNPQYYTETNEYETILQFMCRTAIRDASNASHVDLFVYDLRQAQYILRYFERDKRGYVKATTELHDLGFANDERRNGRPSSKLSVEDKLFARREADRLRKASARAATKAMALETGEGGEPMTGSDIA